MVMVMPDWETPFRKWVCFPRKWTWPFSSPDAVKEKTEFFALYNPLPPC